MVCSTNTWPVKPTRDRKTRSSASHILGISRIAYLLWIHYMPMDIHRYPPLSIPRSSSEGLVGEHREEQHGKENANHQALSVLMLCHTHCDHCHTQSFSTIVGDPVDST